MATTCPRCARPLKKRDRTGHFAICCPYELEPDAWAGGDRQTVATLLRARYDGEEWTGELGGLLTLQSKSGLEVRTDVALALVGGGGIASAGVPVSALVGWGVSPRWSGFADVGVTFVGGGTASAPIMMGGARWRPTDMLAADLAAGWDAELGGPMASLGMAANFGRLRR